MEYQRSPPDDLHHPGDAPDVLLAVLCSCYHELFTCQDSEKEKSPSLIKPNSEGKYDLIRENLYFVHKSFQFGQNPLAFSAHPGLGQPYFFGVAGFRFPLIKNRVDEISFGFRQHL